jgi:hypothetical protein
VRTQYLDAPLPKAFLQQPNLRFPFFNRQVRPAQLMIRRLQLMTRACN